MQPRRFVMVAVIVLVAVALPAAAGEARRIVAVGDVHGEIDGFTAILQETGLIDDRGRWTGGDATLIQMGDVFDRGLRVREVLDLLMRLQQEASAAGGRVEMILGNHEAMNLTGFFRDADPQIYSTFADAKSEKRRDKLWSAVKKYRKLRDLPVDGAAQEAWRAEHPLGWVEYVEAIGPKGRYGEWLRERPVAVMIDGVLFIHGGIGPTFAGMSVETMNDTVTSELKVFDRARSYLVAVGILPETAGVVEVGYAVHGILVEADKEDSTDIIRQYADQVRDVADIDSWLLMSPDGPLWFRGAAHWDEAERGAEMAALLDGVGARRMVVGHTPAQDGTIHIRFDDRVILIDTGMLSSYYTGGRPSALDIADGTFTAVYLGERDVLIGDEELDKAAELRPIGTRREGVVAAR
ncbi:MAG: metallophosphoesterase [Holophagae bacterium]